MDSYILFVLEGQKTEPEIFNNIEKYFIDKDNKIYVSYKSSIYSLYDKLQKDPDLDVSSLLKEDNNSLKNIKFSQIFLFFDYDGHDRRADDETIKKMLALFCEETENGKLYISYPMIEALKHIKTGVDFKDVVMPFEDIKKYKKIVSQNSDTCYQSFKDLSIKNWQVLLDKHLRKMNYICTDRFEIEKEYIEQSTIFKNQKEKHLNKKPKVVSVLSSIPIFLKDYYGLEKIHEILSLK